MHTVACQPKVAMNSKVLEKFDLILKCFTATSPRWTATDIANQLKTPVSTLHGILADMVEMDFLLFSPVSKEYSIGYRQLEMGALYANNFELINIGLGIMHELLYNVSYMGGLSIIYKGWMYLVTVTMPVRNMTGYKHSGPRMPPHMSAGGKAMLAHMPGDVLERYYGLDWEQSWVAASVKRNDLEHEFELIRSQGYALDRAFGSAKAPEVIAAPIFGKSGQILSALSLVEPETGFPKSSLEDTLGFLIPAVNEITLRCSHIVLPESYV